MGIEGASQRAVSSEGLQVKEIKSAEKEIVKYVQRQVFKEEYAALMSEGKIKNSSSLLKLSPWISERALRVGGPSAKYRY